jgi:RNA polymerase sigma factor (sigma-70 family)
VKRGVESSALIFRRESGRLVAALTRLFGVHQLSLAEDVVQDAFSKALEVWAIQGIPENPAAWLMTTAKNRALDIVRRERTAQRFAPEMGRLLDSEWTLTPLVDEAFAAHSIRDEQLRMMFSCCHAQLSEEAQLALILNILCGFSVHEIASAFLAGKAAVEKRISRGKKLLAESPRLFELCDADFEARSSTVRSALYLLFNEGYHGASPAPVRRELCAEALRLTRLLLEYRPAATPVTFALAALFCLHAARLPQKIDEAGDLNTLGEQDRSRWDAALAAEGLRLFERSATGVELSAYHLEAAIAAVHVSAARLIDTDWQTIVSAYDRLICVAPSPVVALNRAIAIGQRDGAERGLAELHAIVDRERLADYPFYPAAIGEFELRLGNASAARRQFQLALALGRNDAERRFMEKRLLSCASRDAKH